MVDKTYLQWPFFEDHHRALAVELENWAKAKIAPLEAAGEEDVDAACKEILQRLGRAGWLEYVVPKAYGGRFDTIDVRSLCLIREILARHSGLADFVFAMQGLGSGPITLFGSDALKSAYLPAVARGEKCAAFALTEPDVGSDAAALEMTAELNGDHYLLSGQKTFVSNGGIADYYVVFARTGEALGAGGISAFLVDADSPGLRVAERIQVMAPHPLARLAFEDCPVPAEKLLGEAGTGFKAALATLDIFRSTVGAAALGFARRALAEATARSTSRRMFNGLLADQQLTQAALADMALKVDASALLVYRAAWTKDSGAERITREAAMAKLYATEAAQEVIDAALQLHGGLGVVSGQPVEKLYREIRALRIYEGASEVQKLVIARQHLASQD